MENAVGTTEGPLSQNNSSLLESHRSKSGGREQMWLLVKNTQNPNQKSNYGNSCHPGRKAVLGLVLTEPQCLAPRNANAVVCSTKAPIFSLTELLLLKQLVLCIVATHSFHFFFFFFFGVSQSADSRQGRKERKPSNLHGHRISTSGQSQSERELLVAFKYRHAEFPSLDHMRHSHIIQ